MSIPDNWERQSWASEEVHQELGWWQLLAYCLDRHFSRKKTYCFGNLKQTHNGVPSCFISNDQELEPQSAVSVFVVSSVRKWFQFTHEGSVSPGVRRGLHC